ncbi:MAG: PD-(D/E)XK nuclease family protein, partial [Candidatus Thermoplasmatota archaeon]|nr:PD-(D/E)XK nuclease family protein [Candidatus Thermoplasmatota archaeon]
MADQQTVEDAMNFEQNLAEGSKREDGFWINSDGIALPVSASDLERHAYCPVSWQLSKAGVSGEGEALKRGMLEHERIHKAMTEFKREENDANRELVIWSWWFAVVVTLSADSAAFLFVGEGKISNSFVEDVGKYLILLALVWLLLAIILIWVPWRRWLGRPFGLAQPPTIEGTGLNIKDIENPFKIDADDDYIKGGSTETTLLIGSIAIALHGIAIYLANDRTMMTFALIVFSLIWLLITSWRFHRALSSSISANQARKKAGLSKEEVLTYSDDAGESAVLLEDREIGLRGRPDQILRVDNQFIAVEQKTGKVPIKPHGSHRMQLLAYVHLVSNTTGSVPDYGILRYGEEALFTVNWDDEARADLN